MNRNIKILISVIVTVISLSACEKDSMQSSSNKTNLAIHLTDAPADYEAVLIDVQDVMINRSGEDEGWTSLENIKTGIYNLLELTGGIDTLIASSELDTGIVSQIRLILGENNSLVIEGDTVFLSTPSAQ